MTASPSRRPAPAPTYSNEADMVGSFVVALAQWDNPWGTLEVTREWDYRTGITDVLVRNQRGALIAFEAKLTDWRRAAHQAYRNTVFAQQAFVVLPSTVAVRASKSADLFGRYRIGLCSVGDEGINVLIEAPENKVLIPWLHERAATFFDSEAGRRNTGERVADRGADLRAHRCVA